MTLELTRFSEQLPAAVVIPLIQNSWLEKSLAAVAETHGLPLPLLQRDFGADHGECHSFYAGGARIFLLGLGPRPGFGDFVRAFRGFSFKNRQRLPEQIGISLVFQEKLTAPAMLTEAAVNGLWLGTYQPGRFKGTGEQPHPLLQDGAALRLDAGRHDGEAMLAAARRGLAVAETQLRIFDLVNAPSNKKFPAQLGEWALASGAAYDYQVTVMDKAAIEATGLHALLAVNQGSDAPPAFIVMEYRPRQLPAEPLLKVGLVGKGVTFDTGGLSIKPSTNMHYMKSDMGGAAAVLGAMELTARLQLPVHLIGIVPATENSVDARSIRPSDVIDSYSGKTIEIIDTDAEGRLILADGLAYMIRHYNPSILIDLATLTGSTVRTFGYHAAALFSSNNDLAGQLEQIGERTGERVWRLPLWDVYKEDLKSDVADIRNFSGRPIAGAIGAAKFLEAFTEEHLAWAHLDIAGVAFADSEFTAQKSATAFGVRLLVEFLSAVNAQWEQIQFGEPKG